MKSIKWIMENMGLVPEDSFREGECELNIRISSKGVKACIVDEDGLVYLGKNKLINGLLEIETEVKAGISK